MSFSTPTRALLFAVFCGAPSVAAAQVSGLCAGTPVFPAAEDNAALAPFLGRCAAFVPIDGLTVAGASRVYACLRPMTPGQAPLQPEAATAAGTALLGFSGGSAGTGEIPLIALGGPTPRVFRTQDELTSAQPQVSTPMAAAWVAALRNATGQIPRLDLSCTAQIQVGPEGWRFSNFLVHPGCGRPITQRTLDVSQTGQVRLVEDIPTAKISPCF